jgi:hypothetical protein
MLKFPKAATIAAVSVVLLSAGIVADPGFAFGGSETDTVLKADTIQVDAGIIAADQTFIENANQTDVAMTITKNGDVVFTPGIGITPKISVPADPENKDQISVDADLPHTINQSKKTTAASLNELVRIQDTSGTLDREAHCLAGAVYFESKSESLAGQLAVAKVVMARAKSGRFPSSICGVVYQKNQFSFVRGNSMPPINTGGTQWKNAVAISNIALSGSWKSPVEGALFFHARRVSPGWKLTRLGNVDNHVFYR